MGEPRRRPAANGGAGTKATVDRVPRAAAAPEEDARARADATERQLGRVMGVGVPALTVAGATAAFVLAGLGPALLTLAAGALLGTIAFFWASIRTLSGDAPVAEGLAGLAVRGVTSPMGLAERKRTALRALKDLELEHAIGKIDDEDYANLSQTYREQAKSVMREMDVEIGPLRERAEELARSHLAKRGLAGGEPERAAPSSSPTAAPGEGGAPARAGFDTMRSKPPPASGAARVPCAKCATSNEPDAVFCKSCGNALSKSACSTCGTANEIDAAFCKKCGTALAQGDGDKSDASE